MIIYSLKESDVQGFPQGVSQNIIINDSVLLRDYQAAIVSTMKPLLSVLHLERTTEAKSYVSIKVIEYNKDCLT